jgi:hypothetical protein
MPTRKTLTIFIFSIALAAIAGGYAQRSTTAAGSLTPQDYFEIQQLYSTYYQTIDTGESEAWANTFTSDGVFNGTKGHDALVESNKRGGTNRPLRHSHTNLKLVPTAEGADGHVYVFQTDITTKPPSISTYSRYDDKLVKTPQGWRFKVRQRSRDTTMAAGSGTQQSR